MVRGCVKRTAERERLTLTATDRRGRTFECGVSCMPLKGTDESVRGAIWVAEPHGDPAWHGRDE